MLFHYLSATYTYTQNYIPRNRRYLLKLRKAKITEKQAIYIINIVILTHLSYRIQNTVLLHTTYDKITKQYTTIIKHKAGFARSLPNSTLFCKLKCNNISHY